MSRAVWLPLLLLLAACGADSGGPPTLAPTSTAIPISGRISFAGSTTMQPLVEKLAGAYRLTQPEVQLDIAAGGSVVGINAVQDGSADIGMSSRELRSGELRSGMRAVPVAIDVLAIIVHPANPVRGLTLEQLRGIYLGTITNWRDLGGLDRPIVPVIREVSSGTRGAFDTIVLGEGGKPATTADVQVTAGEVEAKVASTPDAIGYVGFGNLRQDVQVLTIDGSAPTLANARSGAYRLRRPLLLLTGVLSRGLAQSFVSFALSDAGQRLVAADGWVPVRDLP